MFLFLRVIKEEEKTTLKCGKPKYLKLLVSCTFTIFFRENLVSHLLQHGNSLWCKYEKLNFKCLPPTIL